jgi:TetR/AcrR family transcriptional regulator, transcriptional repressor for nem operon
MRYPKNHKETVRQQLLLKAANHAKEHGFSASGVDALAGAAGLTTGSLYKHFENKNAFFSALIAAELSRTIARYDRVDASDTTAVHEALNKYLSMSHVQEAATGCPVPSLTAEVARASDDVRNTFEAGVVELKNAMAALTGSSAAAWAIMAQNVGAVMIARALRNDALKQEILTATREAGVKLLGQNADIRNPVTEKKSH